MTRVRPDAQTLVAVALLAVLGLIAALTARNAPPPAESYDSTDYGPHGYRAWTELLAGEGIVTGRFRLRPIELDAGTDTLVSAQPAASAAVDPDGRTEADIAALAAWVRRGGHLVYAGRNAQLAAAERRILKLPHVLPDAGARGALVGSAAAVVRSLAGLGPNRMRFTEHAGRVILADGTGDIAVRYPFGRGSIVAVSDAEPFANAQIGRADNARLAYLLGLPHANGGVVAFDDSLHGALVDRPWYRALPLPVRVSLAIGAFALAIGLIGSALGNGVPMRLEPPREPSSAEFIDALAALYERIGARTAARAVLAHDAFACAARAAGTAADSPPQTLAAALSGRAGGADLRRLADDLERSPATDRDLLASAQLAFSVRKEWTNDGTGDGGSAAFAGGARTRRRR
jgi:hypothetical protein